MEKQRFSFRDPWSTDFEDPWVRFVIGFVLGLPWLYICAGALFGAGFFEVLALLFGVPIVGLFTRYSAAAVGLLVGEVFWFFVFMTIVAPHL